MAHGNAGVSTPSRSTRLGWPYIDPAAWCGPEAEGVASIPTPLPTWARDLKTPAFPIPAPQGEGQTPIELPSLLEIELALVTAHPELFANQSSPAPRRVKFSVTAASEWLIGDPAVSLADQLAQSFTMLFPSEDIGTLWHAAESLRKSVERSLVERGFEVL